MSSTNVPSRFALGAMTFRGRRFEDAVAAAAASGFDGIGVSVGQVVSALERGMSVEEMADRVSSHGLRVAELELVRIGDPRVRHLNELVLDLIPVLTPDRIHVAAFHGQPEQVAADLAEVCTRARDTTVAFEFMPYSAIRNVADMQSLLQTPGCQHVKIVLDVVHFFRSGGQLDQLTPDLCAQVAVVQLSDLLPRGPRIDLAHEARHLRTHPGHGTLDLDAFLRAVSAQGVRPPVTVEPISDTLEQQPVSWVAESARVATTRLLSDAGWVS
jgi:sugar phosphate isomerase/epimerase